MGLVDGKTIYMVCNLHRNVIFLENGEHKWEAVVCADKVLNWKTEGKTGLLPIMVEMQKQATSSSYAPLEGNVFSDIHTIPMYFINLALRPHNLTIVEYTPKIVEE